MQFELPKPGSQHKALEFMLGHFIGDETMHPSPWCAEEQQRSSTCRSRFLDDFFLISEYEQRDGDTVTFRGHGVYSWDPQKACYVMYWFDSMGGRGGVAEGAMEGKTLTFQNQSPMGHHRYRYEVLERGYSFEMAMSQDGEDWAVGMTATYAPA